MNGIRKIIDEFKKLSSGAVIDIVKIESWLLENQDDYVKLVDTWYCPTCYNRMGELPCICNNKDDEYIFINLYDTLQTTIHHHNKEDQYRLEIEEYDSIKNNRLALKKWLLNNYKLRNEKYYSSFHYSHCSDDSPFIILNTPFLEGYYIYISKEYFKYNIEFSRLFSGYMMLKEMYEEDEIIQQIDKVICKPGKMNQPLKNFLFEE